MKKVLFAAVLCFACSILVAEDLTYITLPQPCRIVDTRLGGGALSPGNSRSFKVIGTSDFSAQGGNAGGCGVPESAAVAFINLIAVNPQGGGNLRAAAYPDDVPAAGSVINYQRLTPGLNVANGVPLSLCVHASGSCSFDITLEPNGAGVHVVADVLGYFTTDHKHDGGDITSGVVTETHIDAAIARDSEIMPTVLANDGAGSALDADTLDGLDGGSFALSSHDHDALYERKYQRTLVVKTGGSSIQNGNALLTALQSITTNSAMNQYLLKLEPGTYDLGMAMLQMKPFVDIEGSGELTTKITRAGGTFPTATVFGVSDCELRFLTVENTGGGAIAVGIQVNSGPMRLTHLTVLASGGTSTTLGIWLNDSAARLRSVDAFASSASGSTRGIELGTAAAQLIDVESTASGAPMNYAILNFGSPASLTNVTARASGGGSNTALYIQSTGSQLQNAVLLASGGTADNRALHNRGVAVLSGISGAASGVAPSCYGIFNSGSLTISESTFAATDCINNYGLFNETRPGVHSVVIERSTLSGSTNTVLGATGVTTRIGASRLEGGPVNLAGAPGACAGVYDETFLFSANTCP